MNAQLRSRYERIRVRQRGQAVLLTVVALALGFGAVFYSFFGSARLDIDRDKITNAALAQAKEALIGYSTNESKPGVLPCPDNDNDGSADSPCEVSGATAIGRLPWRTLGLPDLRDGSGECLWYAVSANFKNSGTSAPSTVNSNSPGTLVIYSGGTALPSPPNPAVAIVFAPGGALSGQDRTPAGSTVCGGNTNPANYLEGNNAIAGTSYVTGAATSTFNDHLLMVTSDALFSVVERHVAKTVLNALNSYYAANGYYPPPAAPNNADCLGSGALSGALSSPTACPSVSPATGTRDTGRIPNDPKPVPYGGGSDILRGVDCSTSTAKSTYWFQCNGWRELTWMASSTLCHTGQAAPACPAGDLTVWWRPYGTSTPSQKVVVFVAGRALPGDVRSTTEDKTTSSNYVEPANTSGPDYDKGAVTTTFNDKVLHN